MTKTKMSNYSNNTRGSNRLSQSNGSNKKVLIISIVVLVIVVGAGLFWFKHKNSDSSTKTPTDTNTSHINLDPPTKEDLQENEQHKQELANPAPTTPPPVDSSTGKKTVTPVITNASQSEVRAFVNGIVEDGGACTATFTKGSLSFTKQSTGFVNVSTTNCEPIALARSDFTQAGTWTVVVTYSSTASEGKTQSQSFEVQ